MPLMLLLIFLAAVYAFEHIPFPPPPETKDRVPPDRMEQLVGAPMALVRQGKRSAADALFRAQLARAAATDPSHRDEADLLTAYGVLLYTEGLQDTAQDELRRAAIPWLRQAVAATRAAWGPRHPETALALQDLGDALRGLDPDHIPAEAEQAIAAAYAIRLATLGAEDRETKASLQALGQVRRASKGDEAALTARSPRP
jgi:hypothetical protein